MISIAAGERGVIRVFALDMGPEQAKFLLEPGALAQVLGIEDLDMDHAEIFPLSDLEDLGLVGYLRDGCGISSQELQPHLARFERLNGYVLLLRSRAFGGKACRLTPAEAIKLIATIKEDGTDWSAPDMPAPASSKPYSAPKLPPRASRAAARRIGAALFAIVMGAVLLLLFVLMT